MFPIKFDNVIPKHLFASLQDEYRHTGWIMGNVANHESNMGRVGLTLGDKPDNQLLMFQLASYIKLKIKKHIKSDIHFIRAHTNAYAFGQTGAFHYDFDTPCTWTFILFTNPEWNAQWGGEFVCYNPETKEYDYTPCMPNTGVLIPAKWDHYGAAPNEYANCLRTTIGFSFCESYYKMFLEEHPGIRHFT